MKALDADFRCPVLFVAVYKLPARHLLHPLFDTYNEDASIIDERPLRMPL